MEIKGRSGNKFGKRIMIIMLLFICFSFVSDQSTPTRSRIKAY